MKRLFQVLFITNFYIEKLVTNYNYNYNLCP